VGFLFGGYLPFCLIRGLSQDPEYSGLISQITIMAL